MHRKDDDEAASLHFLFHRLGLMNERVKGGCLVALGLHLDVFMCVRRVPVPLFSPHVISEVRVIYGCQEVPRSALMAEKSLGLGQMGDGGGWRGL